MAEGGSVLDFMSMKNYPDMSLDMSMLNSLGKCVVLPLRRDHEYNMFGINCGHVFCS